LGRLRSGGNCAGKIPSKSPAKAAQLDLRSLLVRQPFGRLKIEAIRPSRLGETAIHRGQKSWWNMRILLIDDMRDTTVVLRKLLERQGYEVAAANDSTAGLGLAEAFSPHVVCVDIGLPQIDGYEVARRIRANPKLQGTRIIAISGSPPDADLAAEVGIDAHILKPASMPALLGAIHNEQGTVKSGSVD
jgi:CheY-like chemotaxis protein